METEFNEHEEVINGLVTIGTSDLAPMVKKATDAPSFKNSLTNLLSIPVDRDTMIEQLNNDNVPEKPTMADYLAATMIAKAAMGDTKAYEVIRDTCGQAPVQQVNQDTTIRVVTNSNEIKEYGS